MESLPGPSLPKALDRCSTARRISSETACSATSRWARRARPRTLQPPCSSLLPTMQNMSPAISWWSMEAGQPGITASGEVSRRSMSETGKLADKRALVTGAGTGIGLEIALEFGRQGADVVLHYSHAPDAAESASREIEGMGQRATTIKVDFTDEDASTRLGSATLAFLRGICRLVKNAGITFNTPFLKVQPQVLDTLFD